MVLAELETTLKLSWIQNGKYVFKERPVGRIFWDKTQNSWNLNGLQKGSTS